MSEAAVSEAAVSEAAGAESVETTVVAAVMDSMINLPVLSVFHSLASLLMWLKLLYFMRIFRETGKHILTAT